jgi:phosphatidate cytidylyltransferase
VLRYRLASAIVLIPLIIVPVILGGPVYFALIVACVLISGFEFFQMAQHAGYRPQMIFGLGLTLLFLVDTWAASAWTRPLLTAALVLSLGVALFRHYEGWIVGWGLTLAGALYIGVLGSHFLLMRTLPDGALWTAFVLLATWAADTAAYVTGKRYGRHGFFTSISPKKTWEGAIGGWFAAVIALTGLGMIAGLPLIHAFVMGAGVGIAATAGDLAESVIKRQFGAKDSGATVPGHGGLLDRMDSLLFAAVFAYYYLIWIAHL